MKGVVYYNTKKAISVEPDERVIVNGELPPDGSRTDEKITAYAFINEGQSGDILVCLIDGDWYQFIATERGLHRCDSWKQCGKRPVSISRF